MFYIEFPSLEVILYTLPLHIILQMSNWPQKRSYNHLHCSYTSLYGNNNIITYNPFISSLNFSIYFLIHMFLDTCPSHSLSFWQGWITFIDKCICVPCTFQTLQPCFIIVCCSQTLGCQHFLSSVPVLLYTLHFPKPPFFFFF